MYLKILARDGLRLPKPTITITAELADELMSDIQRLMDHWSPCDTASDYVCEFCGNRAPNNQLAMVHKDNCLGVRYLEALENGEEV
jgi:hypothetical protein